MGLGLHPIHTTSDGVPLYASKDGNSPFNFKVHSIFSVVSPALLGG